MELGTRPSVHTPGSTSMGETPVAVKAGDGILPFIACSDGIRKLFIQDFQDSRTVRDAFAPRCNS